MGGRPVTIRTLDLGGDKIPGKKIEKESNPAMGLRAIRYCLQHREMFRVQLRALLRASAHGNMRIMFPLISGLSELRDARSSLEHFLTELGRAGQPGGTRLPFGSMVCTPSAAPVASAPPRPGPFRAFLEATPRPPSSRLLRATGSATLTLVMPIMLSMTGFPRC